MKHAKLHQFFSKNRIPEGVLSEKHAEKLSKLWHSGKHDALCKRLCRSARIRGARNSAKNGKYRIEYLRFWTFSEETWSGREKYYGFLSDSPLIRDIVKWPDFSSNGGSWYSDSFMDCTYTGIAAQLRIHPPHQSRQCMIFSGYMDDCASSIILSADPEIESAKYDSFSDIARSAAMAGDSMAESAAIESREWDLANRAAYGIAETWRETLPIVAELRQEWHKKNRNHRIISALQYQIRGNICSMLNPLVNGDKYNPPINPDHVDAWDSIWKENGMKNQYQAWRDLVEWLDSDAYFMQES